MLGTAPQLAPGPGRNLHQQEIAIAGQGLAGRFGERLEAIAAVAVTPKPGAPGELAQIAASVFRLLCRRANQQGREPAAPSRSCACA